MDISDFREKMAVFISFPVKPEIHTDKINTFVQCMFLSGILPCCSAPC